MTSPSDLPTRPVVRRSHHKKPTLPPLPVHVFNGEEQELPEDKLDQVLSVDEIRDLRNLVERQERRIDELEAGKLRTAAATPEPTVQGREAADEELTPWLRELRAQTRPTVQPAPEPSYNVPLRWYMRRDGNVVQLQGDSKNASYYREKGFRELSQAEADYYIHTERPKILEQQRAKAALINNLRSLLAGNNDLKLAAGPRFELDVDKMTIPELENAWNTLSGIPDSHGNKRVALPRLTRFEEEDAREADREAALLVGVETNTSMSMEKLDELTGQDRSRASRSRSIEVGPHNAAQFR